MVFEAYFVQRLFGKNMQKHTSPNTIQYINDNSILNVVHQDFKNIFFSSDT